MSWPFTFLPFLAFVLWTPDVPQDVQVSEHVRLYEVRGNTAAEVALQLRSLGPTDETGRRFHALTTWEISWVHRQVTDDEGCRVASIQTYLEVTTTLPKWTPSSSAPAALISSWSRYMQALKLHEAGHKRLGVEAAQEVQRSLSVMPGATDCAMLNTAMQQTGQAVVQEYEERSRWYDEQTQHGVTQGAVFP